MFPLLAHAQILTEPWDPPRVPPPSRRWAVLRILEGREPWPTKLFELKVAAKSPADLKAEVEALLSRHKIKFELRESTEKHIAYLTQVPHDKRTDTVSEAIVALNGSETVDVAWEEKKAK